MCLYYLLIAEISVAHVYAATPAEWGFAAAYAPYSSNIDAQAQEESCDRKSHTYTENTLTVLQRFFVLLR